MTDSEFAFIARYLRPLAARSPGALGLEDDAALIEPTPGMQLVVAKDALVEGIHFLAHDPAEHIAQKMLRVNLSDMAAMGAAPIGYLMALARAKSLPHEWLSRFVQGLAEAQDLFAISLLGGDTVRTPGPLTLSATILGEVPRGQAHRRQGARLGDDIYVSGTLGDGALGLRVLQGRLSPPMTASDYLIHRYRLPEPRVDLGIALRGLAHAAIDISDGLIADLGHVLQASGVGAEIWSDRLPLSNAASGQRGVLEAALGGGDDYELLFTAHLEHRPAIQAIGDEIGLPLTPIGSVIEGNRVHLLDADGRPMKVENHGWTHF